jgi:murein DD-endopeptidase MepM/ murein hydrolase activator NlpD
MGKLPQLKQKIRNATGSIKQNWNVKSKFTIHPFKALHTKTLVPLSLREYASRFGLEMVFIAISTFVVITNTNINDHAFLAETKDNSVIFSYLKSHPRANTAIAARNDTKTIMAKADEWVASTLSNSPLSGIITASANSTSNRTEEKNATTIQDNVIFKTNPADTDNFLRHGRSEYEVVSGDTIISIASSFGISPQTVMLENNMTESSILRPGQKLSILPTNGVSHTIKQGETVESISKKYGVDEDDLMDINDIELPDEIIAGDVIVVPLATVSMPSAPKTTSTKIVKDESNKIALKQAQAPSGYSANAALGFIWPTATTNITQGFFTRHTGLDISNSKMVPIYAAADGFVELSGYRTGYGNTVIINHGNGYKTLYGHASEIYVNAGDQVVKGQTIAKQGRSGRVRGITGIHLHFEVIKDGVKKNPLNYVKP